MLDSLIQNCKHVADRPELSHIFSHAITSISASLFVTNSGTERLGVHAAFQVVQIQMRRLYFEECLSKIPPAFEVIHQTCGRYYLPSLAHFFLRALSESPRNESCAGVNFIGTNCAVEITLLIELRQQRIVKVRQRYLSQVKIRYPSGVFN